MMVIDDDEEENGSVVAHDGWMMAAVMITVTFAGSPLGGLGNILVDQYPKEPNHSHHSLSLTLFLPQKLPWVWWPCLMTGGAHRNCTQMSIRKARAVALHQRYAFTGRSAVRMVEGWNPSLLPLSTKYEGNRLRRIVNGWSLNFGTPSCNAPSFGS